MHQHQCVQCDDAAFFTEGESAESYAICGLLHDLCKANFYKVSTRNVKNDVTGQGEGPLLSGNRPAALRPRGKKVSI